MAIKTKTFTLLGFIFTVACLVSLIVSFASDRWVVSTQKEVSGFENMGLWSACFKAYRPPPIALVDRYYDGCWWVLDREMDELRHYLFPSWFVGTQVLVTLSLVFQLIAIIAMIVNAINCFPYSMYKDKIRFGLSVSTAILHGLTGLFLTVAVILFGARADNERTWLEKPDQNYLSWSFGMCVLAAFLAIITFMCQVLESCRLRLEQGNSDEPHVYLTNEPPPSSNYIYTRQKYPPSHVLNSKGNTGQPAYVGRYSNQGSQSSLNTKPPDTMFAVSGAGEVYINHLADYDENRQRGRNGYAPPYQKESVSAAAHKERHAKDHFDNIDSRRGHTYNSVPRIAEEHDKKLNDYEESKQIRHPVLPEYVPKSKDAATKKQILDSTLDESDDYKAKPGKKKKDNMDSGDESKKRKRSASESKSTKSKDRSDSKKRGKKKGADTDDDRHSESGHSRRRSKKRGNKSDTSDDERSRSRRRSKKGHSSRRRNSHSRDRSHSRDLNSSYSDSYVDSDSASNRGRSRRKHSTSEERSRKDTHKHSTSGDRYSKKKRNDNYTDDASGSEYSNKRKSVKKRGSKDEVSTERKTKSREYSDTESVRSKQSRRPGEKPKGTYSSYYEY